MANLFLSSVFILVFAASTHGWGKLVGQLCYPNEKTGWAYNCTLGIAVLVVAGGFINMAHLAYPLILNLLLYGGVSISIIFILFSLQLPAGNNKLILFFKSRHGHTGSWAFSFLTLENLLVGLLILIPFVFLVYVQMPASSLNIHDDFHVYLVRPFRMLQTGTVGGNPFDMLGIDSLGSYAFLQAFTLLWFDAEYLNTFDAIFCFLLTIALIFEIGRRLKVNIILVLPAIFLFVVINPHYANISSLYSGTLMLLGVLYSYIILVGREGQLKDSLKKAILSCLPMSFFVVSLLTFKATFLFTTILFVIANLLLSILLWPDNKKRLLQINVLCFLVVVFFLLPWIVQFLPKYVNKIQYLLINPLSSGKVSPDILANAAKSIVTGQNKKIISELLSTREMYYGNNYRDYLIAVFVPLLTGITATIYAWGNRTEQGVMSLPSLISLPLSVAVNYYIFGWVFPARLVVRYSCPLIIAAAPVTALLVGHISSKEVRCRQDFLSKKFFCATCVTLLLMHMVIGVMFGKTLDDRIKRVYNYRTLLSYPPAIWDTNLRYNFISFSDESKEKILGMQNHIEPGIKILAWISKPFLLNFTRNRVYTVSESGLLSSSWLKMPLSDGPAAMLEFFRQRGIENFIWEYDGVGMKNWEDYGPRPRLFMQIMDALSLRGRLLYNDGHTAVFNTERIKY
jgi:hypothetical protein